MSRKLPQIAAGAGAGWVTGYVTMKVSKTMPTILLFLRLSLEVMSMMSDKIIHKLLYESFSIIR